MASVIEHPLLRQRRDGWVPADTFGNRLRLLRQDLGISSRELADLTRGEISHASLSNWERGAKPHRLEKAVDVLVQATRVDRDWLLYGAEVPDGEVRTGSMRPPRDRTRPRDGRPRNREHPGLQLTG